jgi:hypothetical protein
MTGFLGEFAKNAFSPFFGDIARVECKNPDSEPPSWLGSVRRDPFRGLFYLNFARLSFAHLNFERLIFAQLIFEHLIFAPRALNKTPQRTLGLPNILKSPLS